MVKIVLGAISKAGEGGVSTLVLGVISGLLAALVFLALMSLCRPRLKFSPVIAEIAVDEEHHYSLKLVNKSRRAAVDIELQLFQVRQAQAANGPINRLTPIPLMLSGGIMLLPGHRRRDPENRFARRVRINANLAEIWTGESTYLVLRCYATDSMSNFGRQFEMRYHRPDSSIQGGTFEVGNSMMVQ